ncbi:hypothetical protein [Streptomyces sp. PH10-H1]|uniref:hypothetical protein n=1 Tax=Streptomyces sp. PH10-H1 TaxID=3046212 RepID=UPI0024B99C0F|nr:hypothetical protein [Streptomyces sp. PH10-H1]MDJ0347250.1 hypothetical protein [Streptomyces sp. PH10-H1]
MTEHQDGRLTIVILDPDQPEENSPLRRALRGVSGLVITVPPEAPDSRQLPSGS